MTETADNKGAGDAGTEPTKMDEDRAVILSLDILRVIREAQQQHGLRHGDYQRYRGYCSRRVRRLRKVLKIPQGDRRHYRRRDVTSAHLASGGSESRLLCVPLVQAERAWAHAMQLRQEANTEPRKRFRLVQRLRKATAHAHLLLELTQSGSCCARTQLEAQAYSSWLAGVLHLELQAWSTAQDNLARAQLVYSQLAAAMPDDERTLYLQKVEELKPSLRYCAYNIGDESAAEELRDLRARGLLHNLDSLMAQAKEAQGGAREVEWRGRRATVRAERARVFLATLPELEAALDAAPSLAAQLSLLENALVDCKEAASAVRDEAKGDAKGKGGAGAEWLLAYLTYLRLTHTVRRNNLLVQQAEQARRDRASLDGKKVRAQDLTRLYEIILQNYAELAALPGLEADVEYQAEVEAGALAYRALRCFHMAQVLVGLRRWREALAVLDRAAAYAADSLLPHRAALLPPQLTDKVSALRGDISSCRFEVHANSVLEAEGEEDAGEEARRGGGGGRGGRAPLAERLDTLRDEAHALSRHPLVVRLPPAMEAVPCKPLFFDLACNLLEFPSLDDKTGADAKRAAASGITGLVKGFLGWGARE